MCASTEQTAPMNRDSLLEELFDRWKDGRERGAQLSVEDLCRICPDLKQDLARRIELFEIGHQSSLDRGPGVDADSEILRTSSEITSLTFHARGGLGAVYRATEKELNREVAVKFIHHNLVQDRESCTRFLLEAEVTGRLEHPGVVPLYGIGQAENGRLFYYMRYIDGETMDDAIVRCHRTRSISGVHGEQNVEFRCAKLSPTLTTEA
jgi:eukaryotic-like serine/threonine-protein kinase